MSAISVAAWLLSAVAFAAINNGKRFHRDHLGNGRKSSNKLFSISARNMVSESNEKNCYCNIDIELFCIYDLYMFVV